jgi:hypothetical protein
MVEWLMGLLSTSSEFDLPPCTFFLNFGLASSLSA